MKRKICLVTMVMLLLMSVPAWADVGFNINGRDYTPASSPILEAGITSASAQMLAKTLGAQLIIAEDTITLTENQDVLQMTIGSTIALFNETERIMPKAPEASDDDILLPIRFVYECFGAQVEWNGDQKNIAVTYTETRNGLTPEEILAQSSQVMQEANTYKMLVAMDSDMKMRMQPINGEPESMSAKMTGQIDGSVKYDPMLIYMVENMKIDSTPATEGVAEVEMEILLNSDGMYMTLPEQGWVKMDIPDMDISAIMEQSSAQDPLDSIKQMADFGMSISLANNEVRDGKEYWVIETTMGPDSVDQYLQQTLSQLPGITEEISDMYKNMSMDMSYQVWINPATMVADYMFLKAKYSFNLDITEGDEPGNMDMDMDMSAAYTLYDFGVPFDAPDVSDAKDFNALLDQ